MTKSVEEQTALLNGYVAVRQSVRVLILVVAMRKKKRTALNSRNLKRIFCLGIFEHDKELLQKGRRKLFSNSYENPFQYLNLHLFDVYFVMCWLCQAVV